MSCGLLHAQQVTLRFVSFPKSANPEPVELLVGEGQTMEIHAPTNALSQPYKVNRLSTWSFGKMLPPTKPDEGPSFQSYGSATALASADQLILLIRDGKTNADGLRVVPMNNTKENFGGGQFFFMNASKADIAGLLGGTKFALKPGMHEIIEPKDIIKRGDGPNGKFFTEFYFRRDEEARPFFSSSWPANEKARSMVFFYHDKQNQRLRMHTIRDYLP